MIAEVSPENIYNFDDTIFQIGQGKKPQMVVTRRGLVPYQTRTYCEWITTIECISANGWAADPFTIVQGDYYLNDWLTCEGTPDEAIFMRTRAAGLTSRLHASGSSFFIARPKLALQTTSLGFYSSAANLTI